MYEGDYFTLHAPNGFFVQLSNVTGGAVLTADSPSSGHAAVFKVSHKGRDQFEIISSYGTSIGRITEGGRWIPATGDLTAGPVAFRFIFISKPAEAAKETR